MNKMSRPMLFLLGLLAAMPVGAELVLVKDGKALAPIVIFKDAPPLTRQAAEELVEYIEKISGARPELIEGAPDPLPERAIWVGIHPALAELFPDLDFDFQHPEEILIAANGRHVVMAGRDRWDPENTTVMTPGGRTLEGIQQEYGTINAIYTFLQDILDVRWLWPGEDGEDIVRRETIALAPFEHRFHPIIRMRNYLIWYYDNNRQWDDRITTTWARRQRLAFDSANTRDKPNGHAFGAWFNRFHETNPEFFALQPDGTRSGFPSPGNAKICQSNPGVWAQWLADVEKALERDPTLTVFNAGMNDSNRSGFCICENCRAWDVLDAPPRRFIWQGLSQMYVSLSDRSVRFANTLARLLRERWPDKDYSVVILGYGPTTSAPVETRPDENVIILHCTNWYTDMDHRDRGALDERYSQQFADWAGMGANLWWRNNLPTEGGHRQGLPDVPFGRAMSLLDFLVEHNCTGFAPAFFGGFWRTQGPLYYMLAQRVWNPALDGREILEDYYRRAFGPAAGPMEAYWTLMEDTRNQQVDAGVDYYGEFWEAYDDGFFRRAEGYLREAESMLEGEPEIYLRRVGHMRTGLDYTQKLMKIFAWMHRYRESRETDAEAAERVRVRWKEIEEELIRNDDLLCGRSPFLWNGRLYPDPQYPYAWSGRLRRDIPSLNR